MLSNGLREFQGRRVLFLQGPLGPFFARLASDLHSAGAEVFKVNFNGGDWLCALGAPWTDVCNFTGSLADWPAAFVDLLDRNRIDTVFLFGDCRPVHVATLLIARRRGIEIGVFEEGYLRPDFITLERGGVNNRSSLPKDPDFYRSQPRASIPPNRALGSTFRHAAVWGMVYYSAASLGRLAFRHYRHHRRLGIAESTYWLRSYWRKLRYARLERHVEGVLSGANSRSFFLVALQTCGDAQIRIHSRFRTVPRFIEHVIRSFARSGPDEHVLVIKHHPLDRGYSDYTELIRRLARRHGIESRCFYIHDQHLPTLLRASQGVVVINSTVGLSAVGEGVPVKVCGDAIYDMAGLTFQGELDAFWKAAGDFRPDMSLWSAFRSYLIDHTQYNGNFYKRLAGTRYRSGVNWASGEAQTEAPTIPLTEPGRAVSRAAEVVTPMRAADPGIGGSLVPGAERATASGHNSIQIVRPAAERMEDLATG